MYADPPASKSPILWIGVSDTSSLIRSRCAIAVNGRADPAALIDRGDGVLACHPVHGRGRTLLVFPGTHPAGTG